jgi:hypothetical protein
MPLNYPNGIFRTCTEYIGILHDQSNSSFETPYTITKIHEVGTTLKSKAQIASPSVSKSIPSITSPRIKGNKDGSSPVSQPQIGPGTQIPSPTRRLQYPSSRCPLLHPLNRTRFPGHPSRHTLPRRLCLHHPSLLCLHRYLLRLHLRHPNRSYL